MKVLGMLPYNTNLWIRGLGLVAALATCINVGYKLTNINSL